MQSMVFQGCLGRRRKAIFLEDLEQVFWPSAEQKACWKSLHHSCFHLLPSQPLLSLEICRSHCRLSLLGFECQPRLLLGLCSVVSVSPSLCRVYVTVF